MKYFEKYLTDNKNLDDIDISVHCDINLSLSFTNLVGYYKCRGGNNIQI
jgi:hypothetical protein